MNKTVTITISGTLFNVEEDAYKALEAYLASINDHFKSFEDHKEIVSDIESRIAEHFSHRLTKGKTVIEEKDIVQLIKTMGTVKDFEEFESDHPHVKEEHASSKEPSGLKRTTRLYRDPEDKMIAGVASGLAAYFGIDPVLIRIIFAASVFAGGSGIIVYILLWIVMPEAKNTMDRIEMQGEPVTLSRIETKIKSSLPTKPIVERGTIKKILLFPFTVIRIVIDVIARVIKILFPLLGRLVGVGLAVGSTVALFMITFFLIVMLTSNGSEYFEVPITEIINPTIFPVILFSLFIAAFIPALTVLLIGISLMRLKSLFTMPLTLGLIGIWLTGLMVAAVTGFNQAPSIEAKVEQLNAKYDTQIHRDIDLKDFTSIESSGFQHLTIKRGTEFSIAVDANERDMSGLQFTVEGGRLLIRHRDTRKKICLFCNSGPAEIAISMPQLQSLKAQGAVHATAEGFQENTLALGITGNSFVEMSAKVTTLNANVEGASTLTLSGSAVTVTAELTGISRLNAEYFPVETMTLRTYGPSSAIVDVRKLLKADAFGPSRIEYADRPTLVIEGSTTGPARIYKTGEDPWDDHDTEYFDESFEPIEPLEPNEPSDYIIQ